MRAGRAQKNGSTRACRTLVAGSRKAGLFLSQSDSIREDFRVPLIPNGEGQRQTKRAGLRGAKFLCLQSPYNTEHFLVWNQPVAEESEDRLRQLKIIYARPEGAGTEMAKLSHFCVFLLYGVFSEFLQTQHAVSMANPEV